MPIVATEGYRLSQLVKWAAHRDVDFHNEKVVVNDAATTIAPFTVLGKVTATGKYKVAKQAASDGSQNAAAVFIGDQLFNVDNFTLTANTDTNLLAIVRGPSILADKALVWDASFTTQAQKDAAWSAGTLASQLVLLSPQL